MIFDQDFWDFEIGIFLGFEKDWEDWIGFFRIGFFRIEKD
jgi:hypothetical protein